MSLREAWFLFGLFWAQFLTGALVPPHLHGVELVSFSAAYLLLAARLVFRDRAALPRLVRDGFRSSYAELSGGG
jgi:cation:H+ antiporter